MMMIMLVERIVAFGNCGSNDTWAETGAIALGGGLCNLEGVLQAPCLRLHSRCGSPSLIGGLE